MDRVGGYLDYLALCEDSRAYDDVRLVLQAEALAAEETRREREMTDPGRRR